LVGVWYLNCLEVYSVFETCSFFYVDTTEEAAAADMTVAAAAAVDTAVAADMTTEGKLRKTNVTMCFIPLGDKIRSNVIDLFSVAAVATAVAVEVRVGGIRAL
jgi:hypothetical protein